MANHVYRFRRERPVPLVWLQSHTGGTAAIVDRAAGFVVDVQVDETKADDLKEAMASAGFEYLSIDPTTDPEDDVEINAISPEAHASIRQLIHFISDGPACGFASGAYKETLPTKSAFPTSIIWWESAAKLKKIVEKTISYALGNTKPTPVVWQMYDTDGTTVLCTVSDAITYDGAFEVSRTRTIT